MILTFILGLCRHFEISRNIINARLSYLNLWETDKEKQSTENMFSSNNFTVFKIPKSELSDGVMVTASLVEETHHLGNVLFQFASMYGIAKANVFTSCINMSTILQTVFENITINMPNSPDVIKYRMVGIGELKGGRKFDPEMFHLREKSRRTDVFKIYGYRQSWKYFVHTWKNDLENRLKFSPAIQDKINHYLRSILSDKSRDTSLVGIHIRRGDFVSILAPQGYTVSNITYIENAIKYYEKQKKEIIFIIATNDLTWTKQNVLPLRKNIFMSPFTSPFDDMCLLASCNDSIITSGSFGWWSAYLAGGSVVYDTTFPRPDSHIGKRFKKEDYYPPHWVGHIYNQPS